MNDLGISLITNDLSPEQAAQTLDRALAAQARMKELIGDVKQSLIAWMEEHDVSEIEVGSMTYYSLSSEKTVKCRDNAQTLDKALELCGGEVAGVAALLSSAEGTWKQGAFKKLCADKPELFEQLFQTTTRTILANGKPIKKLVGVNREFSKKEIAS